MTWDVSHVEMWPYVFSAAVASASHASTASEMVASVRAPEARARSDATQLRPAASQSPNVTPQLALAHPVPINMPKRPERSTASSKHHVDRSWSNAFATVNICPMSVTEQSRHDDRSWSNAWAIMNMLLASSTRDTSQLPSGWLKASAPPNMANMDVTCDTSQPLISSLKYSALAWKWSLQPSPSSGQNSSAIFVTWDVSHVEMWPYVFSAAAASVSHASTAS